MLECLDRARKDDLSRVVERGSAKVISLQHAERLEIVDEIASTKAEHVHEATQPAEAPAELDDHVPIADALSREALEPTDVIGRLNENFTACGILRIENR